MFFPFQLAVDMNAQSLLQYKQLAELQEARMEKTLPKSTIGILIARSHLEGLGMRLL